MSKEILIRENLITGALSVDYNPHSKIHNWEARDWEYEVYIKTVSDKIFELLQNQNVDYNKILLDLIK